MSGTPALDPWQDAAEIGRHLCRPDAELLVVIGAEAWCTRCRRLRPRFDALCRAGMPAHVRWVWLDVEDHAGFLGSFLPPDLPLLLRWRAGQCVQAALLQDIDLDAVLPQPRVRLQDLALAGEALVDPTEHTQQTVPPLWTMLARGDWALA